MAPQLPPYLAPFQLLELNIISAQELYSVSRSMKTYAVAWVHPDRKLSTRVDPHGHANPTWNDKFVFRVDDFFLQNELSAVMIEIYASSWWRDVLVGTVRVLIGNLIPENRPKQSTLGRHQLGMTFVALQVRRPSGRPQGILNIGVGLLDSSMRSMPLYSQLSGSAVGYRDLMGEDDPLHHHNNNNSHQQKHQIVQNYHHESLMQRPELRRTRSDTSSMVFDQPKISITTDSDRNVDTVKHKKGKASSWVSASTQEFGDVKEKKKKKKASSMISGASNKKSDEETIKDGGKINKKINKQAPPPLITKIENANPNVNANPVVNANPPKGIICKPQLKREPSMKRVTIGEHVIIEEPVVEMLKEPESKTSASPQKQATNINHNQEGKATEINNENKNRGEKAEEAKKIKNGGIPKGKASETNNKNVPPKTAGANNKNGGTEKARKEIPISPPKMKLVPPPPPPKYTPLPPPIYTPLQKLEIEKKQPLDLMLVKPYNITDSELGPSPSEVEATIRGKKQYQKYDDMASSGVSRWSLGSSIEGLQSKIERWHTELPPVYDKSEFASYVSDDVVPVARPKSSGSSRHKRRRHTDEGDQERVVSCFSSICGIQCSIACGTNAKPAKKKIATGKAKANIKARTGARATPVENDSVLFF